MNIIKFVVWGGAIALLGTISNIFVSMPLSVWAERRWSQSDNPARPVGEVFPRLSSAVFIWGLGYGALVAALLSLRTWRFYSEHWLPQILLAVALFANSSKQQQVHLRLRQDRPALSGVTGGRFCAAMYGGYWVGALIALAAMNVALR